MKKILALLLALTVVFSLAACGGKDREKKSENPGVTHSDKDTGKEKEPGNANAAYAGTYEGVHCKFVGDEEWVEDEPFSLTLNADGTGVHSRDGMEFNVTWTLDGESFTMNETFIGDPIVYTGTLKDGELHLYNNTPEEPLTYEYVYKFAG